MMLGVQHVVIAKDSRAALDAAKESRTALEAAKAAASSDWMPPEKKYSRPKTTTPVWGMMSTGMPSSPGAICRAMPLLRSYTCNVTVLIA